MPDWIAYPAVFAAFVGVAYALTYAIADTGAELRETLRDGIIYFAGLAVLVALIATFGPG